MAQLNKVFLIGNLTADPTLRYTPNGTGVADLRLAVNRNWSGKDGDARSEVLYIDVTVWDRMAENCCKYLRKGRPVHVEGYLRLDTWDTPNGEKRSKHRIVAENVQFLGASDRDGAPMGGADASAGAGDDYGASAGGPPPGSAPPARRAPSGGGSNAPRDASPNGPGRSGAGYGGNAPAGRPQPAPANDSDFSHEDDDIPF